MVISTYAPRLLGEAHDAQSIFTLSLLFQFKIVLAHLMALFIFCRLSLSFISQVLPWCCWFLLQLLLRFFCASDDGQHSTAVVSTVTSQQEDSKILLQLDLSVWSLHVLTVSAWIFPRYGFLPPQCC